MPNRVLDVQTVEKHFKEVRAVDGLSFDVRRGEVFALLGPNGAGKTTMVRMLMGVIRPDRGSISWGLSGNGSTAPSREQLGYLPEDRGLYKDVPILRTLVYFGVLRGMGRRAAGEAATRWLETLGLADRAADKLDALSKGNQQKVQFIASILHRPAFAVLDEPFSGLDPVNQDLFLELLRKMRADGMTILLSAHQMQLVERVADRILLINHGRTALHGTLAEIRSRSRAANKIVLRCGGRADLAAIERHPALESATLSGDDELTLLVRDGASLSELLVALGSSLDISGVHSDRVSLHDIYVQAVEADTLARAKS